MSLSHRGLDDLSSAQCLSLLKALATGGRTVICVIHTPSARLFHMIDNVYIVAEGQCAFQGKGQEVIPFLEMSCGLSCPKTYNPADFGECAFVISSNYSYNKILTLQFL